MMSPLADKGRRHDVAGLLGGRGRQRRRRRELQDAAEDEAAGRAGAARGAAVPEQGHCFTISFSLGSLTSDSVQF